MITLEEKQAYVSKLLTANQAAELMKPVFYDWIIPPTGNELRVGFGALKLKIVRRPSSFTL